MNKLTEQDFEKFEEWARDDEWGNYAPTATRSSHK